MSRPILAELDLNALRHNIRRLQNIAPASQLWGVIKANAYGHGIQRIYPALTEAHGLILVDVSDARTLREAGETRPILMLEGFFEETDLQVFSELKLTAVVHNNEQVRLLQTAQVAQPIPVVVKFNTGMNRLGFKQIDSTLERLLNPTPSDSWTIQGVMTHFSDADNPAPQGQHTIDQQLACMASLLNQIKCPPNLIKTYANSAALLRYPQTHADWVRPGIALYGVSPFANEDIENFDLMPVMTLKSKIIAIQALSANDSVGYGSTFRAPHPMKIGIVACGYGDGYPRSATTGTPVLVNDTRTTVVGTVSMDMLAIDLSNLSTAQIGSPVTLWGKSLSVNEVAHCAGSIGYELLCQITPRVPIQIIDTPATIQS